MERKAEYHQTSIRGNNVIRIIPQKVMRRRLLIVGTMSVKTTPVSATTSVVLSELCLLYQLRIFFYIYKVYGRIRSNKTRDTLHNRLSEKQESEKNKK
jgi:hypothetical protein